jgi:hypothetical protein
VFQAATKKQKYEKISEKKMSTPVEVLCKVNVHVFTFKCDDQDALVILLFAVPSTYNSLISNSVNACLSDCIMYMTIKKKNYLNIYHPYI